MAQAIQSYFSPAGLGVKTGGAADLFSSEGKGLAFSDVLAGESSRGSSREVMQKPEPVGRADRAEADADRGSSSGGGADAASDSGAADPVESAAVEPSSDAKPEGDREESSQGDVREAESGEAAADADAGDGEAAAEEAWLDSTAQGVATADVAADLEAAQPVGASALASESPAAASAAEAGQVAQPARTDRPQPGGADVRRGESQGAKVAAQQGASADSLASMAAETANPVAPTTAAASSADQEADTTPLVLQPVASGPGTAPTTEGTQAMSAAPTAASVVSTASPVAESSPGPIPVQGGNVSAGAQLTEAHAARSDENAALNNARLARGLASAVNQKGGAVTLRLTPPEMGTVRIQMQLTGTTLAASFHAETASAHALLSQQLGQLRSSLETQGLHVERLTVQPMQQTQQGNNAGGQNDDGQQQNNQQPNDGRSRGQSDRGSGNPRDARQDGEPTRGDGARQPATFDEHLDSTSSQPNA